MILFGPSLVVLGLLAGDFLADLLEFSEKAQKGWSLASTIGLLAYAALVLMLVTDDD